MVDTGQAVVPAGRSEGVRTGEDGVQHEQLCTVEDDPGDVADDEHDHNADQHSRQVQFAADSSVSGLVVSISVNKRRNLDRKLSRSWSTSHLFRVILLYSLEYSRVKEDQEADRADAG